MSQPEDIGGIRKEPLDDVVTRKFLDYGMSVIVNRALPDVRDGLKPVHRRILYAMVEGGYTHSKSFNKSSRIVGEVMGKFHPHGDLAIYATMVRMTQAWKNRAVTIEGQGNFGNIDGDGAAASRYTEARLSQLGQEIVSDVANGTVDFRPNYDGRESEPIVMPARFPNILVNGGSGIAVGMASDFPTHNLGETIDAAILVLDNPETTVDDIMAVMPGPDLPTAGIIMGRARIREAYVTGRGSIPVVGVAKIEDMKRGRQQVVLTEIPFDVVKSSLVERIGGLVNEKEIEGVSDVRDESSGREGVRIVIELRADASPEIVLNMLRKKTAFQSTLPCNFTCLSSRGEPKVMGVVEILTEFVKFRREVVLRRTLQALDKARDEQVRQIALYAAVAQVDDVVQMIRTSRDRDEATARLMGVDFPVDAELAQLIREADPDAHPGETFRFTDVQADAVLRLNLASLTGLAREEIASELRAIAGRIRGLLQIIEHPAVLNDVVRREMLEVKAKWANPRLTKIESSEADDIDEESLVERKDVVVTLTKNGYVKRTELASYRSQKRGGKGRSGMETRDEDFVIEARVCTTRTPLLVFTSRGMVYAIKAWRLPEAAANAKGRPIINFLPALKEGEKVSAMLPLPEDRDSFEHKSLVFVADDGSVRRNNISDFLDIKRNGKIAYPVEDDKGVQRARLVAILLADENQDVLVATSVGQAVRFSISDLRVFQSRSSTGVRGITLKHSDDRVVDACVLAAAQGTPMERDAYLAGGSMFLREPELLNDAGERRPIPDTITLVPAPDAERPDRLMATLAADRMEALRADERFLLTVTANGYGKRSSTHEYRNTNRGGVGTMAASINDTTGALVNCLLAGNDDQLVLMTDGGKTIRPRVADISVLGRKTRGVRLLSVPEGQKVVSVALVAPDGVEDENELDAGATVGASEEAGSEG